MKWLTTRWFWMWRYHEMAATVGLALAIGSFGAVLLGYLAAKGMR